MVIDIAMLKLIMVGQDLELKSNYGGLELMHITVGIIFDYISKILLEDFYEVAHWCFKFHRDDPYDPWHRRN
jgi:hypothetical protein